jgi:peroxiredoxin Q/BCP
MGGGRGAYHTEGMNIGELAPDFSTLAVGGTFGDGQQVALSQFLGQTVVLYFYPKDNTPGCTVQACSLRDAWPDVGGRAVIFGVSPDSAGSHAKFIKKHTLPFPLLVDEGHKIAEAYGVWVQKKMFAVKYMGVERTTVVIGADGKIAAILRKVKPAEHVGLVRAALG